MLTTFPYYPSWQKRRSDRHAIYRTDHIKGVPVHRCWHYVPRRVTAAKRILHEATFIITSTLRALFLRRADIYIVVSPPLLLGGAAWLITRLKRSFYIFHVKDLQPDAAVGLGMLRAGWFTRTLYALESFAYKKAARVAGISREMLAIFAGKGVPERKLIFFPDSVALPDGTIRTARGEFRRKYQLGTDKFLAVYSGNLGIKQGLSILIRAGQLLANSEVQIVICGDGSDRESLVRQMRENKVDNVSLLPLLPSLEYEEMLSDADVCLITQQAGSGNAFFPCKLLATLAHTKPVVTVADAESALARAVNDGGFGVNVPPGETAELASALKLLAHDRNRLDQFGAAGWIFIQQYEKSRVLQDFASVIEPLVDQKKLQ
jgi:colanic acid biosynthesis glycosyl transferase WcaI